MSTTQQHSNIPSTAVKIAPGPWRTNLQRYDLSVPGREMIQSRVDIDPDSSPIRHTHPGVSTSCQSGQEGSRHG
jgi:hypothetical protein